MYVFEIVETFKTETWNIDHYCGKLMKGNAWSEGGKRKILF